MNQYQNSEYKPVYYRLIALWVICEAFAGGIIHAAKLPFSGMIISSLAITCIILIAWYVPTRSAIIKATIIVAIFKLMLSPHSPPPAYIAVFFQGLMGQLLLSNKRYFNISAVMLAVLSLVESAIQRILVLVIIYGNELWKAVNEFIRKLTGEKQLTNYSLAIAIAYILVHAVIGIFVGMYAARLAKRSAGWKNMYPDLIIDKTANEPEIVTKNTGRKKKMKLAVVIIWLSLLALYVQAFIDPKHAIISSNVIVNILLRSVLILLSWYLIVAPLVMMIVKRILRSKEKQYKTEIHEVMLLLPQTRHIFRQAFKLSENKKGFSRMKLFLKILLINVLAD